MKLFLKLTLLVAVLGLTACGDNRYFGDAGMGSGAGAGSGAAGDPNSVAYFNETVGDRVLFEVDTSTLTAEGRATLDDQADRLLRERYPLEIAMAAAAAEDVDSAFEWIERAYALREPWLVFLEVDPRFDPLAADPMVDSVAGQQPHVRLLRRERRPGQRRSRYRRRRCFASRRAGRLRQGRRREEAHGTGARATGHQP